MKQRVYEIMERASVGDRASRAFDLFIVSLIGANVAMVILETVDFLNASFGTYFRVFEAFSVAVFTVEYLLRLWSCTADPAYSLSVTGRIRFALSGFALVDLLAIAPFYAQVFLTLDPTAVGALRLLRMFRLFKMGRYIRSIRILGRVARQKRAEVYLVVTVLFIVLVMVSSVMYFVEHEAQPEAFASIPSAMWWGMVTLTTIGYGDVYPLTPLGKFFGILIAMLGIGMFALPAGILSSGFVEAITEEEEAGAAGVVRDFVDAVNTRSAPAVMSLMGDSPVYIDGTGDRIDGRTALEEAWEKYFAMFPDYAVEIDKVAVEGDTVLVTGTARGTLAVDGELSPQRRWTAPAAWQARVEEGRLTLWRVFADTSEVRALIAQAEGRG